MSTDDYAVSDRCFSSYHRIVADRGAAADRGVLPDSRGRGHTGPVICLGIQPWQQADQFFLWLVDDDTRASAAGNVAELGIDEHDTSSSRCHQRRILRDTQHAEIVLTRPIQRGYRRDRDGAVSDQLTGNQCRNSLSGDSARTITAE